MTTPEPGHNRGTPAIDQNRFLQALVLTTSLSGTAYRLATVYVAMAVSGSAFPSQSNLACMLGCGLRTVRNAQRELEVCGAFTVEYRDGPGQTNVVTPRWELITDWAEAGRAHRELDAEADAAMDRDHDIDWDQIRELVR